MKLTRKRITALTSVALIAALAIFYLRDPAPSAAEKKAMEQYTKDMQPVCFGRFVMDVPRQAKPKNGQMEYAFAGFRIDDKPKTLAQFNLTVDFKIEDLKKDIPYKRAMFYSDERVSPSVRIVNGYTDELGDYFTPTASVFLDGTTILIEGAETNKKEEYEHGFKTKLLALLPRLKKLPAGQMPKEPGFCMVGAYIAGANQEGENADFGFDLKDHPDFRFGVRTQVIDRIDTEPMLVDREASIVKQLGPLVSGLRTLRKRKFQLNGQEAQEWSVVAADDDGIEYKFSVEVRGVPNDVQRPAFGINMRVGGDFKEGAKVPSMSEGEALTLWETLLNSIKPRPGAL